jgi:hypothetical protein
MATATAATVYIENARRISRQGEKRILKCAESHIPLVNKAIHDARVVGRFTTMYLPISSQTCSKLDVVNGLTTIFTKAGYSIYYPGLEKFHAIGFMWFSASE